MRLEMMALERYLGDRAQIGDVRKIFMTAAFELKRLQLTGDCPDDWEICPDGKCEPTCSI
jgi:hypothetical protein